MWIFSVHALYLHNQHLHYIIILAYTHSSALPRLSIQILSPHSFTHGEHEERQNNVVLKQNVSFLRSKRWIIKKARETNTKRSEREPVKPKKETFGNDAFVQWKHLLLFSLFWMFLIGQHALLALSSSSRSSSSAVHRFKRLHSCCYSKITHMRACTSLWFWWWSASASAALDNGWLKMKNCFA